MTAVVIGLGNPDRRDDGVGPAVAAAVAADCPPGVRVVACAADATAILDAFDGADLAVVVDAVAGDGSVPGRVRVCRVDDLAALTPLSSHDLNLTQTYELALVLGRAPRRVVVVTVDAADTAHGKGLSSVVTQAVPQAAAMVLDQLSRNR